MSEIKTGDRVKLIRAEATVLRKLPKGSEFAVLHAGPKPKYLTLGDESGEAIVGCPIESVVKVEP